MARSRNIKHTFFKDDELAELSFENRLYFIGLWTLADCKGRIEYRPKRIKAELFPYDELDIDALSHNLSMYGFVRIYSVQGRRYIEVANFLKHQNPHKNERDRGSNLPEPDEGEVVVLINKGLGGDSDLIGTNPDLFGSAPADSCSLNPDSCSLNPESVGQSSNETQSGKPSQGNQKTKEIALAKQNSKSKVINQACEQAIDYLNEKANKKFTHAETHKEHLRARFDEGHALDTVLAVIDLKVSEWLTDRKQNKYLRPATLFNREKFNNYVGEVGSVVPQKDAEAEDDPEMVALMRRLSGKAPASDIIEGELE